jgi:hypothetical protein
VSDRRGKVFALCPRRAWCAPPSHSHHSYITVSRIRRMARQQPRTGHAPRAVSTLHASACTKTCKISPVSAMGALLPIVFLSSFAKKPACRFVKIHITHQDQNILSLIAQMNTSVVVHLPRCTIVHRPSHNPNSTSSSAGSASVPPTADSRYPISRRDSSQINLSLLDGDRSHD